MKVTEYFEAAQGRTLISFEILPPLKGGSMKTIFDTLDPLMSFKPPFIDVTYHREEYIYKKQESGFYEKVAIRKRPGTVGICAAIVNRYNMWRVHQRGHRECLDRFKFPKCAQCIGIEGRCG